MTDTSPDAEARLQEFLAETTPGERLEMSFAMTGFSRMIIKRVLLSANPNLTPAELKAHVFRVFYADDFTPAQMESIVDHLLRHAALTSRANSDSIEIEVTP